MTEEVGVDTYHHTHVRNAGQLGLATFQGQAIAWSWELLTEVYKFRKTAST